MTVEKISEELGKIEQFIKLLQATYTQVLKQKPDEKTELKILGIDWQDGLTVRVKNIENTSNAFEKTCEIIGARIFKTETNYSLKFTSLQAGIEALKQAQTSQ